jgi:hypothetical protein
MSDIQSSLLDEVGKGWRTPNIEARAGNRDINVEIGNNVI